MLTGTVALWHVYALAFVQGITTALDVPARQTFVGGVGTVAVGLTLLGVVVSLARRDNVVVSYQSGRRPRIRWRVDERTPLPQKAR